MSSCAGNTRATVGVAAPVVSSLRSWPAQKAGRLLQSHGAHSFYRRQFQSKHWKTAQHRSDKLLRVQAVEHKYRYVFFALAQQHRRIDSKSGSRSVHQKCSQVSIPPNLNPKRDPCRLGTPVELHTLVSVMPRTHESKRPKRGSRWSARVTAKAMRLRLRRVFTKRTRERSRFPLSAPPTRAGDASRIPTARQCRCSPSHQSCWQGAFESPQAETGKGQGRMRKLYGKP